MQHWLRVPALYCLGFQPLARVPAMGELKCTSKLDMVLALIRHGFKPARAGMEMAWFPDDADEFCEHMLLRSTKPYFLSVHRREQILERGAQYIVHDGPAAYFTALLTPHEADRREGKAGRGSACLRGRGAVRGGGGGFSVGDVSPSDLNSDDDAPIPTMTADTPVGLSRFAANPELEPCELPPFEGFDTSKRIARFDNCLRCSGRCMPTLAAHSAAPDAATTSS